MPGENAILHLGLIKMRATGTGMMALELQTNDDLLTVTLLPFTLTPTATRLLQRLCNYAQQGIFLRGAAVNLDDTCRVQDITLFAKTIYTEWPM